MNREAKIAMVVGSLIAGLIKTMSKKEQVRGSTIRYIQYIHKGTVNLEATKEQRIQLANACRDSMLMLVEQFKGQNSIMQVATFVESLSFSFERELLSFFGNEYISLMLRFTEKQVIDNALAKDSYVLSDQLRDNIRKIIFESLK